MNRVIGISQGRGKHLTFQAPNHLADQTNFPLMSYLNWHVHLTHFLVSAYHSNGNGILKNDRWFTLVEEWTPLVVSIYKDLSWQDFKRTALNFFSHGDLLTTQANGDNLLQPEESLELVTLASSAINTVALTIGTFNKCKIKNKDYYFQSSCVWRLFQTSSAKVFDGFPGLQRWFTAKLENKDQYIQHIKSFYPSKQLSTGDLFKIYIVMHYQENIMEFLDKDRSDELNLDEITPFYYTIADTLAETIPLLQNQEAGLAFFTYLMHFEEIPIYNNSTNNLISPVHFSNWLLNPQKRQVLTVNRNKIFFILSFNT